MRRIAAWMDEVVAAPKDESLAERVRNEVRELCEAFPAPGIPIR